MIYEQALEMLTRNGVSFTIHQHEPVTTIEDACRKVPHLVVHLIKTVVFRVKSSFWVLAAVRCEDRIDYRKLADALGINRRQLRSLSPEEVEAELHFEIGGVGPLPLREDVRAIFDTGLLEYETVRCGSGKNTHTLEIEFADLLRVTRGQIHPIVRQDNCQGA